MVLKVSSKINDLKVVKVALNSNLEKTLTGRVFIKEETLVDYSVINAFSCLLAVM